MRLSRKALAVALFLGGASMLAIAQDPAPQPDNTKVNKRDRSKSEVTADQQKENASDRDLAKKIRRAIVEDKNLSSYAHNVKVIARDGTVTLKGPVHSQEEKSAVAAKAAEIAGRDNVKNEISVKGDTDADRSKTEPRKGETPKPEPQL
jgi:osmotically-inducible protein OsmY